MQNASKDIQLYFHKNISEIKTPDCNFDKRIIWKIQIKFYENDYIFMEKYHKQERP